MSLAPLSITDAWRYGLPGLPLAFVALPLYVHLPKHYASMGMPLAALGAVLLLARVFDALTDPLIGRWLDGVFRAGPAAVLRRAWWMALALWLGMLGLLLPPPAAHDYLLAWFLVLVTVTTLAYSVLTIAHQSWGARLGGEATHQARIVAWREGWALLGVVLAAVLPTLAGWPVTLAVLAAAMAAALGAWGRGPRPALAAGSLRTKADLDWWRPWRHAGFRRLMVVFVLNGLASAMPATLVLFFIADRLQAPQWEPLFLTSYFLAAALGMPAWLAWTRRVGLARAWLTGMVLSVAVFAWAALLGAGDAAAYWVVCMLSGLALGADLILPAALLAGVIAEAGDCSRHEGAYFGWWNLAAKANLALAAGLALPALAALGYTPGSRDTAGLQALSLTYAVLPCLFKVAAAWLLWRGFGRRPHLPATAVHPSGLPPAPCP